MPTTRLAALPPRETPTFLSAAPARSARAARPLLEVLGCAAVVALWLAMWARGAATLEHPWAPDPETRAALAELARNGAPAAPAAASAR